MKYPFDKMSVYEVFKQVTEKNKEATFLVTGYKSLSYGELLRKVDLLANGLLSLKLDNKKPIAVYLEPEESWAITVLAILKAGFFYVPIDPSFPTERNKLILTDSTAEVIITEYSNAEFDNIRNVNVQDLFSEGESLNTKFPSIGQNTKACIIYTSGSTGKPKGVIQTHQSILHGVWRRSQLQHISSNDRMTWFYSPSVKGSEYCFYVSLLNGASLYVRRIMDHYDDQLIDWVDDNQITVFHSVASYFRYFAGSLSTTKKSLDSLRLVVLGGERVLKSDSDLFFDNFNEPCKLFTALGSTETGTVCHLPFEELKTIQNSIIPIGYPVTGMELDLLNEEDNKIDSGIGRLRIISQYISPGYWNESSDKFTKNEFTNEICYLSGDLAEVNTNGVFFHRGRVDGAVKINGYLVNLLEVETALMECKDIEEAIVLVNTENQQNKLVAFLRSSNELNRNALNGLLKDKLVNQMIPSNIFEIENWPRLANGKIDKPSLLKSLNQVQNSLEESLTGLEIQISEIWKKVLTIDSVSINQTFSEVGGDSVATLKLALEFKKAGYSALNLIELIQNNTISKQAKLLEEKNN